MRVGNANGVSSAMIGSVSDYLRLYTGEHDVDLSNARDGAGSLLRHRNDIPCLGKDILSEGLPSNLLSGPR